MKHFGVQICSKFCFVELHDLEQNRLHHHFRYEVLKGIVDYCYTGSLVVNGDNSLELISIANMFEFEGIKEHCSTYLKQVREISSLYPLEEFFPVSSFGRK